MFGWPIQYLWLAVLIIGVILEAVTLSLTTIWFAISALIVYVFALIGVPFYIQVVLFFVISIVLLIFTKPIAKKYLKIGHEKTNVDSIIGKIGIVVVPIDTMKNQGQIKIKGQTWSARTKNGELIDIDKQVKILAVEGVKLIVEEEK
jgi:membrane protein implicated in regulation of membrane protease activity